MTSTTNETIGARIRKRRVQLKLSQSQVAEKSGVSMQAISLWEHDKTTPSASNASLLAKTLKCEVQWLLEGVSYDEERIKSLLIRSGKAQESEGRETLEEVTVHPSIQEIHNLLNKNNMDDVHLSESLSHLVKLFSELDSSRRSSVLRFAIEKWKEAKEEEFEKYNDIYNKHLKNN